MAYATIRRGASQDGYFAVPVEGSSFFISPTQLAQYALHEDQELSAEEFDRLRMQLLGQRCRQKAMDLLAMREHSRKELEMKLRLKDFPLDVIADQLERLVQDGLLSDLRFAEQFISSRQRKNPEGRQVLVQRLLQRGVERSVAERTVSIWFADEESASDAIKRAAEKLLRKGKTDQTLLRAELFKKGFTNSDIAILFEELDR